MATPVIVVGTDVNYDSLTGLTTYAIHKYDSAGNTYQHGHNYQIPSHADLVSCVAIDSIGNVYFGCTPPYQSVPDYTTYKLDPNGNLVWRANHGAAVLGIAVDDSGNVYTVGDAVNASNVVMLDDTRYGGGPLGIRTGYSTIRKYNSSGVLQWSSDHGYCLSYYYSVTFKIPLIYDNGYLYVGGITSNTYNDPEEPSEWGALTKINATTGAVVWRAAVQDPLLESALYGTEDIAIDGSGNVYIVGYYGQGDLDVIRKYDSSGAELATALMLKGLDNNYAWGIGLKINSSGKLIVLTTRYQVVGTDYSYLHRYDSDLIYEESYTAVYYSITPSGLAIDDDDRIYIASTKDIYDTLWCYPADVSALSWSAAPIYTTSTAPVFGIALSEVEIPPLQIKLDLGIPSWLGDLYSNIPALAFSISLAIPSLYRDYVGRTLPTIYRCYLTGGTGTVEYPASFIDIRKTSETLSTNIVIPSFDESDLTEITEREDGNLIIKKGIRLNDNSEQLDVMITVPFTGFRYDGGSQSGALTLTGSGPFTVGNLTTRTLTGISYRNSSNGLRRIRCAVDTYLQPGDTVELGNAETMTAGNITITIDTELAVMEVMEAVA